MTAITNAQDAADTEGEPVLPGEEALTERHREARRLVSRYEGMISLAQIDERLRVLQVMTDSINRCSIVSYDDYVASTNEWLGEVAVVAHRQMASLREARSRIEESLPLMVGDYVHITDESNARGYVTDIDYSGSSVDVGVSLDGREGATFGRSELYLLRGIEFNDGAVVVP